MIAGKTINQWQEKYPLLKDIINKQEVFWVNPNRKKINKVKDKLPLDLEDVKETEKRLKRFAPFIAEKFPETAPNEGIIESNLENINSFKSVLENIYSTNITGDLFLKCDHQLPIAGSIKARGGIYEVLKHAENLAIKEGLLTKNDDYSVLAKDKFKNFFSQYSLAVGSTGNLGLSIGISGSALGFRTTVHMSHDAKEWKKELLKDHGVIVKEYESDFSQAVKEGRSESKKDPKSYFIDDEKSKDLFLGYAVAGLRLKKQFINKNITVDEDNPLFVYLPCGVGGSPGGICFGLRLVFGDNVHCFFAEPTHSPAVLLGMLTGKHEKISVQDFGIDNITAADGLAVGTPSSLVGRMMENLLSGIYTTEDDILFYLLSSLKDNEGFELEPSALAGFPGIAKLFREKNAKKYLMEHNFNNNNENSTHIVWATGGSMVPDEIKRNYYRRGKEIQKNI
ncbi:D-serine ammonia-lyase [Sporohalobacter salinus]|uniref:D-serine ammonia-lyase n=1 Tax=Sporohalobacter salinus TaxID=1494606 RepID=UPI0030B85877|nr:D-serine dehydratase [Sporohalobacter salinus]